MKLLATLTIALLLTPLAAIHAAGKTKPNLLHILVDDMGWTALSCYGNKDIATPSLDRLAEQGMRFTAAYADAQCSPTRAAFFSGQYGARSRVFKVFHEQEPPKAAMRIPTANLAMQPEIATLATNLRKYATAQNPNATSLCTFSAIRTASAREITCSRSKAAFNGGVTFTVSWSDTLAAGSWSAAAVGASVILSDNGTIETVKVIVPSGAGGRRFVHLKVTQPCGIGPPETFASEWRSLPGRVVVERTPLL